MANVHAAPALTAALTHRFPNAGKPQAGQLDSIFADEAAPKVDSIQAAAVRGFGSVQGKLQWVKATDHFFYQFETIPAGDYVQVTEDDAKTLVRMGKADLATEDDVAKAQKGGK